MKAFLTLAALLAAASAGPCPTRQQTGLDYRFNPRTNRCYRITEYRKRWAEAQTASGSCDRNGEEFMTGRDLYEVDEVLRLFRDELTQNNPGNDRQVWSSGGWASSKNNYVFYRPGRNGYIPTDELVPRRGGNQIHGEPADRPGGTFEEFRENIECISIDVQRGVDRWIYKQRSCGRAYKLICSRLRNGAV